MRASILFSALGLSAFLSAQPVLQYANLGLPGSVYDLYAITEVGDSDFELEGAEADWDFTTSVVDLVGAAIFTYPDLTPYGSDYPDADVALLIIIPWDTTYGYFDVTPTGMNTLAMGVGGPDEEVFSDPSTILQFPFAFGQQFTDDHVVNGSPVSVVRTYSGYGSLQLATGTTENAVKVTASNGAKTWYRSDPVEPVLSIDADNSRIHWERITIGMAEQRAPMALSLVPNPASTTVRIPGLGSAATYRVIDAMGRVAGFGQLSGPGDVIDVSFLRSGLYRVLVQDGHGERTATLLKD